MPEQKNWESMRLKVAVMEERMETMNERYDKGWALLREDMAKRDTEMAKRDTEMAKRDTTNTRWLIGVITAATAIIIAVMAVLLSNT